LIVLHIAAVLFYLWKKRENLIKPMINGDKLVSAPVVPSRDDASSRIVAAAVFAVCVALVTWLVKLGG
jgi:hypothetical protein